jgi:group I intron endonuclease
MEKLCGIYKITSPSKKIYIGQSNNIKNRFRYYKKLQCKKQLHLYNSFIKYGVDKHKFEILHLCTIEELNTIEKYYVDLYQTFNTKYGMNLRDGGGNKTTFSDETRLKMSLKKKGIPTKSWIPSKETRELWSKQRKGRKQTLEQIEAKRLSQTGKKLIVKLSLEESKKRSLRIIAISKKRHEEYLKTGIQTYNMRIKKFECKDKTNIQSV